MAQNVCFINKPKGLTSFDICFKLRPVLKTKAVGHTGTLDPNATGVMIILFDKTCKANNFLVGENKEYIAKVAYGFKTDTGDIDGNIIAASHYNTPTKEELDAALKKFLGISKQRPPLTSAIKIKGKKLYEYQRQNIDVEVPLRTIEVSKIELLAYDDKSFTFKAEVSSGTYIRSLAQDILANLGILGTLEELKRTKLGAVDISMCDDFSEALKGHIHFYPLKDLLKKRYFAVELNDEEKRRVLNGQSLKLPRMEKELLLTYQDQAMAIYERREDGMYYTVRGLF